MERLSELSRTNPGLRGRTGVLLATGRVEELIKAILEMKEAIVRHIAEVRQQKQAAGVTSTGPQGRGAQAKIAAAEKMRNVILAQMREEYHGRGALLAGLIQGVRAR